MNLIEELHALGEAQGPGPDNAPRSTLFLKKQEIWLEMAKRIEALERRLDAKERARGYVHFPDLDGCGALEYPNDQG